MKVDNLRKNESLIKNNSDVLERYLDFNSSANALCKLMSAVDGEEYKLLAFPFGVSYKKNEGSDILTVEDDSNFYMINKCLFYIIRSSKFDEIAQEILNRLVKYTDCKVRLSEQSLNDFVNSDNGDFFQLACTDEKTDGLLIDFFGSNNYGKCITLDNGIKITNCVNKDRDNYSYVYDFFKDVLNEQSKRGKILTVEEMHPLIDKYNKGIKTKTRVKN